MTPSATASSPAHGKQARQNFASVSGSEAQLQELWCWRHGWRGWELPTLSRPLRESCQSRKGKETPSRKGALSIEYTNSSPGGACIVAPTAVALKFKGL